MPKPPIPLSAVMDRHALTVALNQYEAAGKAVAETVAALPEMHTHCCDDPDVRCIEVGHEQICGATWTEAGGWHGVTDGWDDMTESGAASYMECQTCDTVGRVPATIDWN
jgi:hypothetical protein